MAYSQKEPMACTYVNAHTEVRYYYSTKVVAEFPNARPGRAEVEGRFSAACLFVM